MSVIFIRYRAKFTSAQQVAEHGEKVERLAEIQFELTDSLFYNRKNKNKVI